MYLAHREADLDKTFMNDNIFRYYIKTTAKWRCKLATSSGIVMSFTITDTGFNPV